MSAVVLSIGVFALGAGRRFGSRLMRRIPGLSMFCLAAACGWVATAQAVPVAGSAGVVVGSCPPTLASAALPWQLTEAGINPGAYAPFPHMGQLRALMLFADFSDAPGDESPAAYYARVAAPMSAWVTEASYGRLKLDVTLADTWFRMPRPTGGYNLQLYVDGSLRLPLLHDAVTTAAPEVDFRPYSLVFIVLPESAGLGSSPWLGVFPETGIRADGNDRFNVVLLGNDTRWVGTSALTYAMLGSIGLPPLNAWAQFGANPVGPWDVMSLEPPGAGPLAWHRWLLGWLDANQFACLSRTGSIVETLTPLEQPGGLKAVVIPTGRSAAYVVEARQPIGIDAGLCDQGVLLYSVDARRLPFTGPIHVISSHRGQPPADPAAAERCGPLYNAPFNAGPGEVSQIPRQLPRHHHHRPRPHRERLPRAGHEDTRRTRDRGPVKRRHP